MAECVCVLYHSWMKGECGWYTLGYVYGVIRGGRGFEWNTIMCSISIRGGRGFEWNTVVCIWYTFVEEGGSNGVPV